MSEMNPHTLEALKESIAHWERLASGRRKPNETTSVGDCALCGLFNQHQTMTNPPVGTRCKGCPVFEKTGKQFCINTPFATADKIVEDVEKYDEPLDSQEFKDAAELELEFLRSLLPPVKGEV